MLKFISIASGSKGNVSFIETNNCRFLIDAGLSYLSLKKELEKYNLDYDDFSGILLTHIHGDHSKGLKQIINKSSLKVFIPSKMKKEVSNIIDMDYIELIDDTYNYLDLNINLIYTSHDTECSVGYIFESSDSNMVYITDTGYINRKYLNLIKNKNMYFLESNHDVKMLMDGSYPYYLKQRVNSDYGHLSNEMCAKYLSTVVGDNTKCIVLAHISEKNNTYQLAYDTVKNKLDDISYQGILSIAKQDENTDIIEV